MLVCLSFSVDSMSLRSHEQDYTFVPTINSQSKQLMQRLVIPHDFLSRQEYFDEQKRRKQCENQRRLVRSLTPLVDPQ